MDKLQSEKSIKINCTKHLNDSIQFIQINEIQDDKQLFYCNYCLNESDNINFKNYVFIDTIEKVDESQVIDKWPPFKDQSIHKKIKQCFQQKIQVSQLITKIETFFENMKQEIIQKIEQVKKAMINNSQSFSNKSSNIQEKYQELSQLKIMKQILYEQNMDSLKKENKFREFIQQLESQKEKNTEIFEQLIQQHELNQNLVDFESPDKIKRNIIQMIDKINIFSMDKDIIDSIINTQEQINVNVKVSQLFDLISTKSNYCSSEFLSSIKILLNQINPLIEKIPFEEIFIKEKKPIDFSQLSDNQIEQIRDFSQNLTILSKEPEKQNKQIKEIPQIKEIMSVLNLKSNYLKSAFIIDFEKYLVETYPLFNKIKFDTIFSENQKIQTFNEITDESLNNIVILLQKLNEFQNNGHKAIEQTLKIKQQQSEFLKQYYFEEDLDQLYKNYPIFDLLNPKKQIDILQQMQMIKTNYGGSQQYLQIVKNQNNQISISQNNLNGWTNCVSNFILDENANYVFRFQFINNSQSTYGLHIGLQTDSQKDLNGGQYDKMSCFFQIQQGKFYYGCWGIDKKEKGDFSLLKGDNQKEIEMRVCIKDEILQILDYPNYNHILSITDKNKLKEQKNLRLYVGLGDNCTNLMLIQAIINKEFQ